MIEYWDSFQHDGIGGGFGRSRTGSPTNLTANSIEVAAVGWQRCLFACRPAFRLLIDEEVVSSDHSFCL